MQPNIEKKKILLFIKTPPPVTGATLMNQRVYESKLLRKHLNIRSICISYAKSVNALGAYSIKKLVKVLSIFFSLLGELLFHRPRFVYFQISPLGVAFFRDLIFISLIKIFRVKILYHLHGKGIKNEIKTKWMKLLYKFTFKGESVICLSHLLTYDIKDVYQGHIHIVNNGIPDIDQKYLSNPSTDSTTLPGILFLSNLIEAKGIFDFIDALEILKNNEIGFYATIVGAESDVSKETLRRLIQEKGLSDIVRYAGAKYGELKHEEIYRSDLLVFPTKMKHETFGNINLEAMQFSKPIISTNIASIPDIVDDGKTGFLVDVSSPILIADKIELLIKNPELRISMGAAARKKYEEKYTLAHFENNLLSVFNQLLNEES